MSQNFLADAVSNLSDAEAVALFHALSCWVDGEQDRLERLNANRDASSVPEEYPKSAQLDCAEGVLSKLSDEFMKNAKGFWYPGHP